MGFTEKFVWYIAREISCGLTYLKSQKCAHRDLKSENIFLSTDLDVKIADFGFSRFT
jgi:serine kinase